MRMKLNNLLFHAIIILSIFFMQSCAPTTDDETEDRNSYVGTWSVSDQSSRLNYIVTITINPSNSTEILLNNFADLNTTAVGLVIGRSVVIDNQQLGTEYSVNGSGSYINSRQLEFNFSLNNGIDIESRVASFTK